MTKMEKGFAVFILDNQGHFSRWVAFLEFFVLGLYLAE